VFNDTINVVEPEEGLDGETFFLYVFLGAIIILLLVGGNHLLSTFRKKSGRSSKYTAHKQTNGSGVSGTTSVDGIDYEWIPKEHLQQSKFKSTKNSN
jgi:translocon-associated protein subunit alpha